VVVAAVAAVWLALALAVGGLLALCIRAVGGHGRRADLSPPLYVADVLAHAAGSPEVTSPGEAPSS
jgi:hypothetical protein